MPLLQGLRRVRERLEVSVRELSAKSGVSAASISDFEELATPDGLAPDCTQAGKGFGST